MERNESDNTLRGVFGALPSGANGTETLIRTPLHIDFKEDERQPSEKLRHLPLNRFFDLKEFNAIGSAVIRAQGTYANGRSFIYTTNEMHLPVLDVDGGAQIQRLKKGSKLILKACQKGNYEPESRLRDVLGDHDIDLEVFTTPNEEYSRMVGRHIDGNAVTAVVLRSKEENTFDTVDSTLSGHSHVYIQKLFSHDAHATLIEELANVGIVGDRWKAMTEQEGMSIVRTPWTERLLDKSWGS